MFSGGILESACLSIGVSFHPSVCPSLHKLLLSVKELAGYQVTFSDSSRFFTAKRYLAIVYVGKQPVAFKECCVRYY